MARAIKHKFRACRSAGTNRAACYKVETNISGDILRLRVRIAFTDATLFCESGAHIRGCKAQHSPTSVVFA